MISLCILWSKRGKKWWGEWGGSLPYISSNSIKPQTCSKESDIQYKMHWLRETKKHLLAQMAISISLSVMLIDSCPQCDISIAYIKGSSTLTGNSSNARNFPWNCSAIHVWDCFELNVFYQYPNKNLYKWTWRTLFISRVCLCLEVHMERFSHVIHVT